METGSNQWSGFFQCFQICVGHQQWNHIRSSAAKCAFHCSYHEQHRKCTFSRSSTRMIEFRNVGRSVTLKFDRSTKYGESSRDVQNRRSLQEFPALWAPIEIELRIPFTVIVSKTNLKNVFCLYQAPLDAVGFVFLGFCFLCSVCWPYAFCYFAEMTTQHIVRVGGMAFEANWMEYPVEVQKYITLIIARSQYPTRFTGLGIISCTLEMFSKVKLFLNFMLEQKVFALVKNSFLLHRNYFEFRFRL